MKPNQKLLSLDSIERRRLFYENIEAGTLTLSDTVKLMRKLIGKTQPEFAKLVKVTLPLIRAIEQGRANPTAKTLNKMGAPFGLQIIFGRKANSSPMPDRMG